MKEAFPGTSGTQRLRHPIQRLPEVTIHYLRYVTGLQASAAVNGWRHHDAITALVAGYFRDYLFRNLFRRKKFRSNLYVG